MTNAYMTLGGAEATPAELGAKHIRWGLGLFIFGLVIGYGPWAHYMHGALAEVGCLACRAVEERDALQARILALNPGWTSQAVTTAPDGDAELPPDRIESFQVPDDRGRFTVACRRDHRPKRKSGIAREPLLDSRPCRSKRRQLFHLLRYSAV